VVPGPDKSVLDEGQIADALMDLPGWELRGKQIAKTYTFKTFAQAIEFVNAVAELATKLDHHPDIHIAFSKVKIFCGTHKHNAVTTLDTQLAAGVEKAFEAV